jgi:hypothetical protein
VRKFNFFVSLNIQDENKYVTLSKTLVESAAVVVAAEVAAAAAIAAVVVVVVVAVVVVVVVKVKQCHYRP